jgi:hypothetical protein
MKMKKKDFDRCLSGSPFGVLLAAFDAFVIGRDAGLNDRQRAVAARIQALCKEDALAHALASYINPDDPEFDAKFAQKLMSEHPDWFTKDEKDRLQSVLS